MVKNLSEMQDTRVGFLGREHPLEKEMTNHSSILAWRIPWTEEAGRLYSQSMVRRVSTSASGLALSMYCFCKRLPGALCVM